MTKLALITLLLSSCALYAKPLPTESHVEVNRYVGKWYAHYSLPQFFTKKCRAQTAEYEVINEKTISVLNTCLKSKGTGTISGKAVVKNVGRNSELVVTFNNFFTRLFRVKGDYNIIKLDQNYEYVLVGSGDRKSLWLMSRSDREIPEGILKDYLEYAKELEFPVAKLVRSQF